MSVVDNIPSNHCLNLRIDRELKSISLQDIIYIKSMGNYVKLYLIDGIKYSMVSTKRIQNELPEQLFIRIHKSCIVNKSKVTRIGENEIWINDTAIPIGKTYKQYVHHLFRAAEEPISYPSKWQPDHWNETCS